MAVLDQRATTSMLHTLPLGEEGNEHYTWHIEIIPKLSKVASLECTGSYT